MFSKSEFGSDGFTVIGGKPKHHKKKPQPNWQKPKQKTGPIVQSDARFFREKIISPVCLGQYRELFAAAGKTDKLPKIRLDMEHDKRLQYIPYMPETQEGAAYRKFVHIGQRKLIMQRVQHLTYLLAQKDEFAIVVYAGAAPCNPIWAEHLLFPNVKYILVDPNAFNIYITNYRDTHHYYYDKPENKICYFGYSDTNENRSYDIRSFGIKWFDGHQVQLIPNKLAPQAHAGVENTYYINTAEKEKRQNAIKYFYESDDRLFLIENYFTNDVAEFIKELVDARPDPLTKFVFWSDIRTGVDTVRNKSATGAARQATDDDDDESGTPTDLDIYWNTAMMYSWCRIMEPDFSQLKFRLPFGMSKSLNWSKYESYFNDAEARGCDFRMPNTSIMPFFSGDIYIQCWCKVNSTETRLWLTKTDIVNNNIKQYKFTLYEETLFWYNVFERTSMHYRNPFICEELCFDQCGDCSIEATIWEEYKDKLDSNFDALFWVRWIGELTTRHLCRGGHGHLIRRP
jgi:hypothetical protein